MFFKDKSYKRLTEKIYKVPLCIQDTIPIYRISRGGIFELEKPGKGKKEPHLFDKMYLFEDIPKDIFCIKFYLSKKWIKPVTKEGKLGLEEYNKRIGKKSE